MSTPDRVVMVPMGRATDPLLEEIIAAQGYEISHAKSPADVFSAKDADTYSAVAMLVGEGAKLNAENLLREAAGRMPLTKFLLTVPREPAYPQIDIDASLSERVLLVQGETGSTDTADRIRQFLRGDGYCWGSDLSLERDEGHILSATKQMGVGTQGEVKALLRFAGDLSRFTELQPMLQEALQRYLDILACDAGSIYLWDEHSETLVLEAAHGPDRAKRVGLRQKLGEGLAGWVAEVGEPILVTDTRKVEKLRGRVDKRYSNFSCLAVPVTHSGQLFGVVCLTTPRNGKCFAAADLRLAEALAQKLASVIRPLGVLSELRRFSERLLGAFKSSADMVLESDAQVEALRAISGDILDSVPMAVIAYDHDLRVRSSNLFAKTLFGTAAAPGPDQQHAPLEEGIELQPQLWRRKLSSIVETARKVRLQRISYKAGPHRLLLDIHGSPLRDSEGVTIGGILTVQDVTEDAEMEAKLSSAERLALIGKIAAKVAHELNNPLDGILRFLNLAVRQIEKPELARSYLEESRNGLLRMGNILSELLAFSRSQRESAKPVSLTRVVRQSLAQYEHRAHEANITLDLHIPPDLPTSSSSDVWEVFANVIKNALDAMGKDGVLTVRAEYEGDTVKIVVADTGPGVPEELRDRIFDPFFTTKKSARGTGLGLALCRDSLRRIGGEIRLVPCERGATFEITVPAKAPPE